MRAEEADMVAAENAARLDRAVIEARADADADAGAALERLDAAYQHRRTMDALVLHETRREVRHPDLGAGGVDHDRLGDRRVALIGAAAIDLVGEGDLGIAPVIVAGEQAAEHRIAVEARHA